MSILEKNFFFWYCTTCKRNELMIQKKLSKLILVFLVIGILLFSPFLLVLDVEKFSPFVLSVWFIAIIYFLFLKKRIDQRYGLSGSVDESIKSTGENQPGKEGEVFGEQEQPGNDESEKTSSS